MNVPIELFQIAFVLAVVVVPTLVMTRLVAGHEDYGFGIFAADHTLRWPHGVQEEEPQPWRFGSVLAGSGGPKAPSGGRAHESDRALRLPAPSTAGC